MTAIAFSLATFVSTMLDGLFAVRFRQRLKAIMAFTAGVLVSVVFFDVLPEIFGLARTGNYNTTEAFAAILVGFFGFHILEKLTIIHAGREEESANQHHPTVGLLAASGLSLHSFLDGVGIGLGFHISTKVGLLVSIAIIANDFSDGLNTITLMLKNQNTVKRALSLLFVDAAAPVLGAASTYFFQIPNRYLIIYLGIFAGFLLYIGASDLLPEAHNRRSSLSLVGLTLLGVAFIFVVTHLL